MCFCNAICFVVTNIAAGCEHFVKGDDDLVSFFENFYPNTFLISSYSTKGSSSCQWRRKGWWRPGARVISAPPLMCIYMRCSALRKLNACCDNSNDNIFY